MQSLFCRTPPCGSSRPMDQSGAPAGLQARRSGGVHNFPVARPDTALRRVMGLLLRGSGRQKSKTLLSAPLGTSAICRRAMLPNRGVRERPCADAGCHAAPRDKKPFCCEYSEGPVHRNWHRPQCVCRQRGCARGVATAGQSSFSQLKLSENRRKHFSSRTTLHVACRAVVNAFQQYEWLASLAMAKLWRRRRILELAHPPLHDNGANSLEIHDPRLLKSSASRQEKASACNRNCATTDEHFFHDVIFDRRADVNVTGT
jgi:hypothetical protein